MENIKNTILREAASKYSREYVALLAIDLAFYSNKMLTEAYNALLITAPKREHVQSWLQEATTV